LATEDVNRIEASIGIRRQAPIRVWNTEVLMVERIQELPPKFEVTLFRKMESL